MEMGIIGPSMVTDSLANSANISELQAFPLKELYRSNIFNFSFVYLGFSERSYPPQHIWADVLNFHLIYSSTSTFLILK